jgi:hypothetical protein
MFVNYMIYFFILFSLKFNKNTEATDIEQALNIKTKKNAREVGFSGVFKNFLVSGLVTLFLAVQLFLIYLSFFKIVHHCSSLLGSNSKGTQKIHL